MTNLSLPSRRAAFGALAGLAPAVAAAARAPDPLIALGEQLRVATDRYEKATDEAFEAAFGAADAIVAKIIATPAATLGGLRVKSFALLWTHAFEPVDLVGSWGGAPDVLILQSIVDDLGRTR